MSVLSLVKVPARAFDLAKQVSKVAAQGLPALRAALYGARAGAGAGFSSTVLERLGFEVVPGALKSVGERFVRAAGSGAALVFRRGDAVLRAGTRELLVQGRDGIALRVTPSGNAAAAVASETVAAIARTTTRGALINVGRAAMGGAASGALLEGLLAAGSSVRMVWRGEIDGGSALRRVALSAARGAMAGAVGVAAAGLVSFGLAATGVGVAGAPVIVPLATMVVAGAIVTQLWNRRFGESAVVVLPANP